MRIELSAGDVNWFVKECESNRIYGNFEYMLEFFEKLRDGKLTAPEIESMDCWMRNCYEHDNNVNAEFFIRAGMIVENMKYGSVTFNGKPVLYTAALQLTVHGSMGKIIEEYQIYPTNHNFQHDRVRKMIRLAKSEDINGLELEELNRTDADESVTTYCHKHWWTEIDDYSEDEIYSEIIEVVKKVWLDFSFETDETIVDDNITYQVPS